jgi:hypothetical protein
MEIAITVVAYKAAKEKMGDRLPTLFTSRKKEGDTLTLPLFDLSVEDLDDLAKAMKSHKDENAPKVAKLVKSLKDPENKKIEDLKDIPNLLKSFLSRQEDKNLHSLQAELRGVAYLPLEVEYHPYVPPRSRHDTGIDPYVTLRYCFNSRHGFNEQSIRFEKRDAHGTIPELLRRHNLMAPDETMAEDYQKIKKRYLKFSEMHGDQFECRGQAFETGGRWWWHQSEVDLTVFGEPSKCVLDTEFGVDKYNRNYAKNMVYSKLHGETCAVPVHPVLPVFSLVHHRTVWVNVGNMRPYEYDNKVQERLILPDTHRRLIAALVSNLDALRDETDGPDKSKILKSKAKSSVILNYGPPGTGKTLSAEVYAETIERPLYEVQAAQIGSTPEEIETNMREILNRSLRLKMPLLINEADAFVGARGKSLELDQVVAVFLRLLEYHTGLIFLTTNRDQDIDDAIKSRCIALIEFKTPERKERMGLWKVQLQQFGLELSKQDLLKAVRAFPTIVGRDIQNLIKLTHRAGMAAKEEFNFENLRHYALFRGIKVLSDDEMAAERAKEEAAKAAKEAKA